MKNNFEIIGFDADDTLWMNESYYRETEDNFYSLLSEFCDSKQASALLFHNEVKNLDLYGYGAKGFTLSMIETALSLSNHRVSQFLIDKILDLGKALINKPLILLEGAEEVLEYLFSKNIRMIVATKGDLLDQERKLKNSELEKYFHHIEIMSEKKEENYARLISHLDIKAENFLMIGNSLKSDIIPVLNLGGSGIHVPYHTTWQHEVTDEVVDQNRFKEIKHIKEIKEII
jgi:putative hydrolase of the HAD superfamily